MRYLSVTEIAKKWNLSARSVRTYCTQGRLDGVIRIGKNWHIPENTAKPAHVNKKQTPSLTLLDILQEQKVGKYPGGIYQV